jgi:hypothetical protein
MVKSFKITLSQGLYKSLEILIDHLNCLLEGTQLRIYLRDNKVIIKLFEKGKVKISETQKDIFTLPTERITEAKPILEGETEVKLDSDMKNVYVYCNIVAARQVGDVMVPLQYTVPILNRRLASVFRIYNKPHYVLLSHFSF